MRLRVASALSLGLTAMLAAALPLAFAAPSPARAQGVAADGQKIFAQRCASCHGTTATEKKPLGPHLAGIVGRKAAADQGFKYSPAFQKLSVSWDEKSLDEYLAAPGKLVPGTTMAIGVPQQADREDLVAYLKTLR